MVSTVLLLPPLLDGRPESQEPLPFSFVTLVLHSFDPCPISLLIHLRVDLVDSVTDVPDNEFRPSEDPPRPKSTEALRRPSFPLLSDLTQVDSSIH